MEAVGLTGWHGRRVLVTGHTGFKGAWLCLWLERLGARVTGVALPPATGPNLHDLLAPWPALDGHHVDLTDRPRAQHAIAAAGPEVLFHLAGQALVPQAQRDPAGTFAANVMGTVHVLEAALAAPALRAALIVTTDKVYAGPAARPFREDDRLGGDEPYALSKVAAELAVAAWRPAFAARGRALGVARAGNVIGGGDWAADRLVPDLVRAQDAGAPAAIRNQGAVRPWQHVLDPLAGYLAYAGALLEGVAPPALNFGAMPEDTGTVQALLERFLAHVPDHPGWHAVPAPALRETAELRLDASLARETLGWRPRLGFDAAVDWTASWYAAHRSGVPMRPVTLEQIARYEALP